VRRIRIGEVVDLCDGNGTRGTGTVTAVTKTTIDVNIASTSTEAAPQPSLTVVQAVAKGDRAEMAVEILTELGVTRIVPWAASRSVAKLDADKGRAKWQRIAREATKQSRRAWMPEVAAAHSTAQVLELIRAASVAFVLHEGATQPLAGFEVPATGEVIVIVGPEGGIAPDELTMFEAAGAHTVRLGPHVLRTSTAGAAALAVLASTTESWR
jgi:16S rRNA (uracil1498-N3)-methyltransferase